VLLALGTAALGLIVLWAGRENPGRAPDQAAGQAREESAGEAGTLRTATAPSSPIASPGFHPARYEISARYTESPREISGTQRLRYVNAEGRPMRSLFFRLWTNEEVFEERGGGTEVSRATVGGRPARIEADGTVLRVVPESPIPQDRAVEVVLDFTTRIPGIPAPFGHADGLTSLGVWHPVLAVYDPERYGDGTGDGGTADGWSLPPTVPFGEPYHAETADYEVNLTLPDAENLVPVATGAQARSRTDGEGQRTVTYRADSVRDFALAIGRGLTKVSQEVDGTTVNVYLRPGSEYRAQSALDLTARSLAYFSELFGPYPYPELDVVDAPLLSGTEYSTLTFANIGETEEIIYSTVVPHEVAHQWWYVLVGSDQYTTPWLDEALATYSEWLFTGDAATRFSAPIVPAAPLDSPVDAFPDTALYQEGVYLYGAQAYRDLIYEIGEDTFFRGLRAYVEEHSYGMATERDLVDALSEAAGKDLAPFFEARGVTLEDVD